MQVKNMVDMLQCIGVRYRKVWEDGDSTHSLVYERLDNGLEVECKVYESKYQAYLKRQKVEVAHTTTKVETIERGVEVYQGKRQHRNEYEEKEEEEEEEELGEAPLKRRRRAVKAY